MLTTAMLLGLAWKSVVVAALTLGLLRLARRRSAGERSMTTPRAPGNWLSTASSSAPDPVPQSSTEAASGCATSAASTEARSLNSAATATCVRSSTCPTRPGRASVRPSCRRTIVSSTVP